MFCVCWDVHNGAKIGTVGQKLCTIFASALTRTCHPSGSIKCDKVSVVYCLRTSRSVALTPLFVLFCFVAGGR